MRWTEEETKNTDLGEGKESVVGTIPGVPSKLETDSIAINDAWQFLEESQINHVRKLSIYLGGPHGYLLAEKPGTEFHNNWISRLRFIFHETLNLSINHLDGKICPARANYPSIVRYVHSGAEQRSPRTVAYLFPHLNSFSEELKKTHQALK